MSYLTADHLGSPRVITNQNGTVTTRKDYLAFGEEASSAQRTANPNYDSSETRKGYTGYEKDTESGLEFAQARYYNATHGRFTSVDPLTASATIRNPQTFNRYSYVLNSPYKFVDPLGLISQSTGANGGGAWCSTCETTDDTPWFADPIPEAAPPATGIAGGSSGASGSPAGGAPEGVAQQQETEPPLSPCPPGHMCFGQQATQQENNQATDGNQTDFTNGFVERAVKRLIAAATFTGTFGEIVLGSRTPLYNCIAWGLDFNDRWIQPQSRSGDLGRGVIGEWENPDPTAPQTRIIEGDYTTSGIEGTSSVASAYSGWEYKGGPIPKGFHLMRVFEDPNNLKLTHVMRREADGTWSSKNGQGFRYIGITNPNRFAMIYYPSLLKNGQIKDFVVPNRR